MPGLSRVPTAQSRGCWAGSAVGSQRSGASLGDEAPGRRAAQDHSAVSLGSVEGLHTSWREARGHR